MRKLMIISGAVLVFALIVEALQLVSPLTNLEIPITVLQVSMILGWVSLGLFGATFLIHTKEKNKAYKKAIRDGITGGH